MFDIIRKIGAITRTIQIESNQKFKPYGLNNNQFIYVIRLCEQPGMFLAELADSIQIDRTTSFRTVKKLVAAGYLTLQDDAQNRKIKRVYPTDQAQKLYPMLHQYEQASSERVLDHLTQAEIKQLDALLKKIKM